MTAKVLLIRHAVHDGLGDRLSGRAEGAPLTEIGRSQARAIGRYLSREPVDRIMTSPVRRARETARIIASELSLQILVAPELDEIDFGEWEGRAYAELEDDPRWRDWNAARSVGLAPDGETMVEVQRRALDYVRKNAASSPDSTMVIVTHCDVIRSVVAGVLGLSLDNLLRFKIDPASISRIDVGPWGALLHSLNETALCAN